MADDDRLAQLKEWAKDRDLAALVRATLAGCDCDTVDALAADNPVEFDQLYEAIEALLEDVPESPSRPW